MLLAPPLETLAPGIWETVQEVIGPHVRNTVEAVIVMILAWLTIQRALGWLPKKAWASGVKRLLSLVLGVVGLIMLEEMVGGVEEMSHHGTWWAVIWDHKQPIFYGLMAGGLTPLAHPYLEKWMPGIISGNKKK